ncbi:MAG TPA: hypothetical protein VEG33_15310, partial [Streptosporangiaceae bacterium]|nr:hypothetical protein [Streptosporangiaceae bacterium]
WSFCVRADDRIELRANTGQAGGRHPSRWLTVTDPAARELAISCGAALFNLRMAIRVTGHDLVAWLLPDPDGDPALLASVEVVTGRVRRPTADEQELYGAIPHRHTYRWPFSHRRVRPNVLAALASAAAKEQGWLRVLFPFQVASWLRVATHAESVLSHDELYLAELLRWTSGADDGFGIPEAADGPQPFAVYPPVRDFSLGRPGGRPVAKFESHTQLLSLATSGDQPLDWLRAGQALQRTLLTGTRYGVAASFLTQPLELADHDNQPRRWPGAWPYREWPQMLVRVGYPDRPAPVTPREAVPDVVDMRSDPPRRVLPPGVPPPDQEKVSRWVLGGTPAE